MVKRILVILSGTPYTKVAVQHALELSGRHGAEITGCTITDTEALSNVGSWPIGGGAAAHDLVEHRKRVTAEHVEEAVEMFATACRDAGVIHCIDREEGHPDERLRKLWRYHDLMIAGLRGILEYGVVRNPDDMIIQLVEEGVRPVLAVSATYRPIARVLIAYDGSSAAAMAMKRVIQPHFWPNPTVRIAWLGMAGNDAVEQDLEAARQYCRAHGVDADVDHAPEATEKDLLDYAASWNADLLALGCTQRSRLARYVLGDTTLRAIRNAEIPLFLSQ